MQKPLTPDGCDLTDFEFMPLSVVKLRKSKAWLICKRQPHLAFYMINLWTAAWHEVPSASLEDDDDVLADLAMCPDMDMWLSIRDDVLRGFTLCDDGRLYHEVVAIKALEAWLEKLAFRVSSGYGNSKRWGTPFDPASLVTQMDETRALLFDLAPMSKAFAKKHSAIGKRAVDQAPPEPQKPAKRTRKTTTGKPAHPVGTLSASGVDPVGVASESKGTGTVKGEGEVKIKTRGEPLEPQVADAPGTKDPEKQKHKIAYADRNFTPPDWVPLEAWKSFEEVRWAKHSRAPYTLRAQAGLLSKLESLRDLGNEPEAVLSASVRNGWSDLYALKGGNARAGASRSPFSPQGMATLANAQSLEDRMFGKDKGDSDAAY